MKNKSAIVMSLFIILFMGMLFSSLVKNHNVYDSVSYIYIVFAIIFAILFYFIYILITMSKEDKINYQSHYRKILMILCFFCAIVMVVEFLIDTPLSGLYLLLLIFFVFFSSMFFKSR